MSHIPLLYHNAIVIIINSVIVLDSLFVAETNYDAVAKANKEKLTTCPEGFQN